MNFVLTVLLEAWHLLLSASAYMIFGLLVSGLLRIFMNPASVAQHFGHGRIKSVVKAALLGIPIPLCSCGVLPAAVSLKKQGANNGATTAFLISTPESGVDSIAISYALLDPIMTVARPVAAFFSAIAAGITENLFRQKKDQALEHPDLSCPIDACCDGLECPPDEHSRHHTFQQRVTAGVRYAFVDVWGDLVLWFFIGLLLAGLITVVIPAGMIDRYLGGGVLAMILMLVFAIPLYICATASTPIAAALILKGVSPGAALVFLLAGPATNVTSLTVLFGVLGKRATAIYLLAVSVAAVGFGLLVDKVYHLLGVSPQALVGQAGELVPPWAQVAGGLLLLLLSIKPLYLRFSAWRARMKGSHLPETGSQSERSNEAVFTSTCAGST
jgi:uncharacterized membrane protein YraQ (UPF0718 family)